MNKQILKRFDLLKKAKGVELDLGKVEFELLSLGNEKIFKFSKGLNKYIRTSVAANPGEVPVVGASLDNDGIYSSVTPISPKDLVNKPSVTFNKDNAKGSRAFFRDYPFVMDRHHIGIIPNEESVFPKFLYHFLDNFLIAQKFGWGENVATVELIQEASLPIPKPSQGLTSVDIQKILVEFIQFDNSRWGSKLEKADQLISSLEKLERAIVPKTLAKSPAAMRKFSKFLELKKLDFDVEKLEFTKLKTYQIGEFKGGSSKLTGEFIKKNEGDYPVYTASTDIETKGMAGKVNTYDYDEQCIHLTKNGENTGTVFLMEKHKHSLNGDRGIFIPNENFSLKYIYQLLVALDLRSKHNWGNKLSKTNFENYELSVPIKTMELNSKEIQALVSNFFDLYSSEVQRKKGCIQGGKAAIPIYNDAFIKILFASLKNIAHAD